MREVSNSVDFAADELRTLARWDRERTFEQSVAQREGGPRFVFYDGPPFATGLPHYGHLLTSYVKDVVPRYHTMRGSCVPRRWGWDCHGLPVELEVEKDSPTRDVGEFNAACRALVLRYQDAWEDVVTRLGRWVDMRGAYTTMDAGYTDAVVGVFAALHARGLVYEGDKVVAYCTRCQTPLSNFETRLDDAYRERVDPTVTVRFPTDDGALLAWTTTPWTLVANAALAVNPALDYLRLVKDGDVVWSAVPQPGYVETARCLGRELVGKRASSPFGGEVPVLGATWVTASDGTGVVHLAPAFGEVDQLLCAEHGVTGDNPMRDDGTLRVGGQWRDVADASAWVAANLGDRLFARGEVCHDYPHCWRCDRPLVYRAVSSWYVAASQLRERMVACNARVRWVPPQKRFDDWLANARDWAVSRHRMWGAPVPVWRCDACRATHVVGSRAELAARSGREVTDWHRPAVDEHAWACACGGTMRRVPDVLDCWFESGAMPFATNDPSVPRPSGRGTETPYNDAFPADFVAEYVAQTRGWFYTMLVLSTALRDEPPFKAGVCHGVLLGEDGRKLSKRLRNYPDPLELMREHGSDALRVALMTSGVVGGQDVKFSAASVRDVVRRLHLPLWNSLHLFTAYAALDGYEPGETPPVSLLDHALHAEADQLRADVEAAMADYDLPRAYTALEGFVTTLSTWYVRLAKPVLWGDGDKRATYDALYAAFVQLARVAAPFVPFLAEAVYEALGKARSVHLEDWPAPRERDDAVVADMRALRAVVRLARKLRERAGVKHRQPLREARVAGVSLAYADLLASELNVKVVGALAVTDDREPVLDFGKLGRRLGARMQDVAAAVRAGRYTVADRGLDVAGVHVEADELTWRARKTASADRLADGGVAVWLDLAVDDALAREGVARDLARALQDLRKQAGLRYGDRVDVAVPLELVGEHAAWLCAQVNATRLVHALADPAASTTVELAGAPVALALRVSERRSDT